MRVLVTGANGMLGLDLCPMLEAAGHEVVRTDTGVKEGSVVPPWTPLDVTDTKAVAAKILEAAPDAVIHSAAYTNVDGCERDPDLAFRVNALGTWNVATACASHDVTLAYISTDFVFDGEKQAPYTEFDRTNPLSHYGASKLAGEHFVQQQCRKHIIARTAWLFGAQGKSFPGTILHLAETQKERNVVADQVGCPTHTVDLSRKLIQLLDTTLYGIYHVTNSGWCNWARLAEKTLQLAGIHSMTIKPIPADSYPSPTRRPSYSVLQHYALQLQGLDDMPPWEQALADYIRLKRK